jgi:hypothetical protein
MASIPTVSPSAPAASGAHDDPPFEVVDPVAHAPDVGDTLRRCLFSCPRGESSFLGTVKPRTLLPGRAQFVNRQRGVRLVQTLLVDAG